jgi:hypothetical protein
MRDLVLVKDDEEDGQNFWVQYLDENTFNVYCKSSHGDLVPIILDAECQLSETKKD